MGGDGLHLAMRPSAIDRRHGGFVSGPPASMNETPQPQHAILRDSGHVIGILVREQLGWTSPRWGTAGLRGHHVRRGGHIREGRATTAATTATLQAACRAPFALALASEGEGLMVCDHPFERVSELWHKGTVQVAVGIVAIVIGHFLT